MDWLWRREDRSLLSSLTLSLTCPPWSTFDLKLKILILYLVEDLLVVPDVEGVDTLVEVMSR